MKFWLRVFTGAALSLACLGWAWAEPAGITTGYQFIGWKDDACIVVEEITAADGSLIQRLESVNPLTQKLQPILDYSSKESSGKKTAFEAKIAEFRRTGQTGIVIRSIPSIEKTEGAAGMISTPIVIFPEQSPQMRPRIPGRYFLDLVSSRGNFQPITELTAWLQQNHPKLFEPSLAWGPNFYLDTIALAPQGAWAAVQVEVRYGTNSKDESSGAVLAFFRAKTLSAKLYNLDGFKAYQIKEYYTAIPYFQWATAQDPTFDIPVYNLACTYGLLGLDEPAVTCLVQACRMNPLNKDKAKTDPDLAKLRDSGKLDFLLKK